MMTADGVIDGTWELTILVTDLQVERTLRVKGDLHIGGVMLKLVDALGQCKLLSVKDLVALSFLNFTVLVIFLLSSSLAAWPLF